MNKTGKIFLLAALTGFLWLVFAECNPKKKIIKEPIKDKKADYLFGQLKKNEFKFEWLSIKYSATIKHDKGENSFSGNIKIRKDSVIWISLSPGLGIELARALITPDSVKMLNRNDKTYFAGDFKYINTILKTDVDFDMLQSLLVGNDFSYYETNVFKATVDGMQYKLSTVGRGKLKKYIKTSEDSLSLLTQDIWLDPETYKIVKEQFKEIKQNRKLEAEYSNFNMVDSLAYPFNLHFTATTEKEKIEISIENTKVSATGPLEFPFNVSDKYQRVYFNEKAN